MALGLAAIRTLSHHDKRVRGTETPIRRWPSHCGRVIACVADDHDLPASKLRSWLLMTFITELGTRGRVRGHRSTAGMPNAVVRALEDRHLLSAELRSGSRWYELISDRLIEPLQKLQTNYQTPPNRRSTSELPSEL